jgi:hypothetical protein
MWRAALLSLFAIVPTSTNYTLNSYDFGNGSDSSTSTNYSLHSQAGSNGGTYTSTNYALPAGVMASTTVPTPPAPTFTNPDTSYTRLQLVLNVGTFPSDTKYAIAISTDNFATTKYVQTNQTVGTSFTATNYQTYGAWGGVSGFWVLDLANNTTYQVKVAALQGAATGSGFGPSASATTSEPSVTFGVTTSLTGTPPFNSTFTNMPAGSVVSADAAINTAITTNASQGGEILIKSQNAGLTSSRAAYTLSSADGDLTVAATGYGAQVSSTSQSSGGPMVAVSPFNGTANTVGGLTASWQKLATFNSAISGGTMSLGLLAKVNATVPSATDYSDVITLSVSLLF